MTIWIGLVWVIAIACCIAIIRLPLKKSAWLFGLGLFEMIAGGVVTTPGVTFRPYQDPFLYLFNIVFVPLACMLVLLVFYGRCKTLRIKEEIKRVQKGRNNRAQLYPPE